LFAADADPAGLAGAAAPPQPASTMVVQATALPMNERRFIAFMLL